jgi:hypothetical protein
MLIFYCYFANKIFQLQPFQFHLIELQTIVSSGKTMVYDALRKKHVLLTPEEEVRQKLIIYLLQAKKVPAGLIAIERGLTINGMMKRFDLVIYNSLGRTPFGDRVQGAIGCFNPKYLTTISHLQSASKGRVFDGQQRSKTFNLAFPTGSSRRLDSYLFCSYLSKKDNRFTP